MDDPRLLIWAALMLGLVVVVTIAFAIGEVWRFVMRLIFGKETKASIAARRIRFIATCDQCGAEVPMMNESLIGHWHHCPGCGAQFKVRKSRDAVAKDRKPPKPSKTRGAS